MKLFIIMYFAIGIIAYSHFVILSIRNKSKEEELQDGVLWFLIFILFILLVSPPALLWNTCKILAKHAKKRYYGK